MIFALQQFEWSCPLLMVCVKIFIVVSFSNAMNPREILLVPSLCRAIVPGPYARSRSVSLVLQRSGQTWIISRPDYRGLQSLKDYNGPRCTFRRPAGLHLQARNQNHFHLTFWLVWSPTSQTSLKTICSPRSHACQEDPRSPKLPRYPGLSAYQFTKIWIARSKSWMGL